MHIYNSTFDIIKHRKKFFILSLAITVIGVITLLVLGLNRGVDFKSGTTLDIVAPQTIDQAKADQFLAEAGTKPSTVTMGGSNHERVSARYDHVLSKDDVSKVKAAFTKEYGDKVTWDESTVDTDMANELATKAIYSILFASLGIIIYVSIRFEWRFAVAAIIALLHDAFIVVSLFSIFRLQVDLPFIAAILTIVGYSINDTIVIFDRIRENLRFGKTKTFEDLSNLVNRSIWQTMTRSINTVITVFIGAICLFIFGSEGIKLFSLAMIFGLISGAYSSIFIASPIWLLLKSKSLHTGKRVAAAKQ